MALAIVRVYVGFDRYKMLLVPYDEAKQQSIWTPCYLGGGSKAGPIMKRWL